MLTLLLILLPLIAACAVWGFKKNFRAQMFFLRGTTSVYSFLTLLLFFSPELERYHPEGMAPWLGQDNISRVFLGVTAFLFLVVSLHTRSWLAAEKKNSSEHGEKLLPDHVLVSCLLAFLATMTLVISARNFGLLWVAVEATTLVSAPLILFHRTAHAVEAMWKYLLICSVGIGLALFGTMLLAVAGNASHAGLGFDSLRGATLQKEYFKAAFIFILAGYGTKMGLAPFHTWLPDAHSEAPGIVSALLSGALLNCSFLGIVRFCSFAPAELKSFCGDLLIFLGVLSLATAAFFIIRQTDFKRMLAYSSVEHMGLIAILWGLGADSVALIHICGHSVLKMTLFLLAGNILLACGTRRIPDLGGLFGFLPKNSFLWVFACLMICGAPPSPLFVTEYLLIARAGFGLGSTILILLFMVFAGMTMACLKMTMGPPGKVVPESGACTEAEKLRFAPLDALILAVFGGIALLPVWMRMIG